LRGKSGKNLKIANARGDKKEDAGGKEGGSWSGRESVEVRKWIPGGESARVQR